VLVIAVAVVVLPRIGFVQLRCLFIFTTTMNATFLRASRFYAFGVAQHSWENGCPGFKQIRTDFNLRTNKSV